MVTRQIPLVRINMFVPFIRAVERVGGDANSLLAGHDIAPAAVARSEIFVPVQSWYGFVEDAARALDEPHFGYYIGKGVALETIPTLRALKLRPNSLSEAIARLIADARHHTTLGEWTLAIGAEWATFKLQRSFMPDFAPAQIDAFGYGFFTRIVKDMAGPTWNLARYSGAISDPNAIPAGVASNLSVSAFDQASYTFPSDWLFLAPAEVATLPDIDEPEERSIDVFRKVLRTGSGDRIPTIAEAARLCGRSVRSLQRMLASEATNFRLESGELRLERAKELLVSTDRSMSDIAAALGYAGSTAFGRSFKKKTGWSPSEYRQQAQINVSSD